MLFDEVPEFSCEDTGVKRRGRRGAGTSTPTGASTPASTAPGAQLRGPCAADSACRERGCAGPAGVVPQECSNRVQGGSKTVASAPRRGRSARQCARRNQPRSVGSTPAAPVLLPRPQTKKGRSASPDRRRGVRNSQRRLSDTRVIALDLEERRTAAPELLAGAVHLPGSVAGQVVGDPRLFTQFDDVRLGRVQMPERMAIRLQGIGRRTGVAAIVLGAGRVQLARHRHRPRQGRHR